MLILPIKKKWFDMIVSGEKTEEYREIKPYYDKRLLKYFEVTSKSDVFRVIYPKNEKLVIFRNGYSKNSPHIKCCCILQYGYGFKEWGAIPDKLYYILKIIKIYEVEK